MRNSVKRQWYIGNKQTMKSIRGFRYEERQREKKVLLRGETERKKVLLRDSVREFILQYFTMIMQRARIIMGYARIDPGTFKRFDR